MEYIRTGRPRRVCALALAIAVAFLSMAVGCTGEEDRPSDGRREIGSGRSAPMPALLPIDGNGRMRISAADRCPVCAMRPIRYPKFSGAIVLTDRTTYYFCSAGCLIRARRDPEIYLGVKREAIEQSVVRDYFTGAPIDAGSAFWVDGSDIIGPMGPARVPIFSETDASTFVRRHGGRGPFRWDEFLRRSHGSDASFPEKAE
jgi:copper chaperone NosL